MIKVFKTLQYSVGLAVAVALLAGCNAGGQSGIGAGAPAGVSSAMGRHATDVLTAFRMTIRARIALAIHPNHRKSWMIPQAKGAKLIYVSDADTGSVEVYNYTTGAEVGAATGFNFPDGSCNDTKGNVYVTDFDAGSVTEFAYGSTSGTTVISGLTGYPIGCSVSRKSGDLAVTQFRGGTENVGSVLVYGPGGSGTPTAYNFFGYTWPAGYDKDGNLFAEGYYGICEPASANCAAELPYGGSSFSTVTLNHAIGDPAAVEYDGKYIGFGDQQTNGTPQTAIYRSTCSSGSCTVHNTVTLSDDNCENEVDVMQWAEYSRRLNPQIVSPQVRPKNKKVRRKNKTTQVAGGNMDCTSSGVFNRWAYPAGGIPVSTLSGPELATGQTIVK